MKNVSLGGVFWSHLVLWFVASTWCLGALAQNTTVFYEQGELKRGSRSVTSLGPDLAGDRVDLYTGSLTITRVDVDLPGNDALRVAWGQRINLSNHLGRWDPEIPRISGTFASGGLVAPIGWVVSQGTTTAEKNKRCTYFGAPPWVVEKNGSGSWDPDEFWSGNRLYVPGEVDEAVLTRAAANTFKPDAGNYPLVTKSHWQISCIPLVLGTGEGFLALSPNGTQYRFDRLVSRPYGGLTTDQGSMGRQEVWILPSLVTDRFGNTVTYSYDSINKFRVTSIVASDGRRLSYTYQADGSYTVTAFANGTSEPRVWSYSANGMLVTLPDGTQWTYSLQLPTTIPPYNPKPECGGNVWSNGVLTSQPKTNTITTPSGATVSFVMDWVMHGNSGLLPSNINPCPSPIGVIYSVTPTFAIS